MKKTIKKTNRKIETKHIDKTKALKWTLIGVGIACLVMWISWFTCDSIFVANGIAIDDIQLTEPIAWHWNRTLFKTQEIQAIIVLGLTGAFMGLLFSYITICGLNIRNNIKPNLYQIITSSAALIAILICVVKAAEMMIAQKYVIDITVTLTELQNAKFDIYHLDFLKWMSIPPGAILFAGLIILKSTISKFDRDTLIKDSNLLIMSYAVLLVALFIPFVITFGFSDPAAEITEIATSSITWRHITAQCITSPIGVFGGMLVVLMVLRIVCVVFAYNNRWHEKKNHLIIYSILTFLAMAGFIVAHVNPLDFEKLVMDYASMKVGGLLVVLASVVTGLAGGIYCLISHIEYTTKRA